MFDWSSLLAYFNDGRSIYGGPSMSAWQREMADYARRQRVASRSSQSERGPEEVRGSTQTGQESPSMGNALDATAVRRPGVPDWYGNQAAAAAPRTIADSGMGGSRATTAAQAEGGGGGSFNKYVATLQALRAGYPDMWSMMVGDKTPRVAFGQNRAGQARLTQAVAHFAWEIERRWKDYKARGGQLDMTGFINKYDYPQNRAAYIEQRALEDNIARAVQAGKR